MTWNVYKQVVVDGHYMLELLSFKRAMALDRDGVYQDE